MDAETATDTALYRGKGEKLCEQALYRDLDLDRLWLIGYRRALELVDNGRAPDQGYLVVSARNAMWDALRRIYAIDSRSPSITEDDRELHEFLRPDETLGNLREQRYFFRGPYQRRGPTTIFHRARRRRLSPEAYKLANKILTPKERRVADKVLAGLTQEEIAEKLGHKQPWISKLFRRSIRKLLDCDNPELQTLGTRLMLRGRETRRGAGPVPERPEYRFRVRGRGSAKA